jgi:hypothetical protein
MFKKIVILCAASVILAACAGADYATKVKPMQRKDKRLSCKEVLLEMNEAEFYRRTALKNRGPKLKNILMPLGYISTYMNSEEAIEAAEARVAYLDQIYEIMRCSERDDELSAAGGEEVYMSSTPAQANYAQPAYYYQPQQASVYYQSPYGN